MNQFGSAKPVRSGIGASCAQCETMLADVMDDALTAAELAAFDQHVETCDVCRQMLADARRGASMLAMLKVDRPEPATTLFERILAQTSGPLSEQTSGAASEVSTAAHPSAHGSISLLSMPVAATVPGGSPEQIAVAGTYSAKVLPFRSRMAAGFNLRAIRHTLLQPRLAMTAAMAFFSVALTLNLTGVHLNELRASDLKPSSIRRSVYSGGAHVVRYYENLRVVYELESRVRDIQRANESDSSAPAKPAEKSSDDGKEKHADPNQKQNRVRPDAGTSERQLLHNPAYKLVKMRHSTAVPASERLVAGLDSSHATSLKQSKLEGGLV